MENKIIEREFKSLNVIAKFKVKENGIHVLDNYLEVLQAMHHNCKFQICLKECAVVAQELRDRNPYLDIEYIMSSRENYDDFFNWWWNNMEVESIDDDKLDELAYDLSNKESTKWWEDAMNRWKSLPKEEQQKYRQFIGFNDFSDVLLNKIENAYKAGYCKAKEE